MTPLQPPPNSSDETACSLPAAKTSADQTALDAPPEASCPTDVTVMRVGASAPTVNEMADATNFGKYQLEGELARGGMGVVYRARQHGLDRLVALKMILGTGTDPEAAQRFLQEARAAAALDHPNVVPIYDIDEIGGRPYFTMALIEGPNLRGYVDAAGVLPAPAIVSLFAQIVAGVAHAHKHGIVHRDLKPANVLIDKDGRPRVTDFGLAKRSSTDSQLTATGQVVGTPAYMAPEQARESKDVGPPADVYSLGAILYFLITGKPPFNADNVTDLLIKVVMEAPLPPRHHRPDTPADIEDLCLRCLSKTPAERFADAHDLLAALSPLTDQYLAPSANPTPSMAQIAFAKGPTTPSLGSMPFANSANSVPSLPSALPKCEAASATAAPATAAQPNRTPRLIALVAVVVVMLGIVGYLVTRDKSKPNPSIVDAGTPGAAPPVAPANVDKHAWPPATRADFGLKVALVAPAATKDADGSIRLTSGTKMKVHVTAARDCYVSVWVLDPTGSVTRLFPNEYETDGRLTANQERVVPGDARSILEAFPTAGEGHDRLRVIATTGAQPAFPAGAKAGEFTVYAAAPERELVAAAVRGIVVKKAGAAEPSAGAVAEVELLFRVQK